MNWILGLIAYVGWGTGDIFGAFASRKVGAFRATAYIFLFGFLIASLYIPFAWSEIGKITLGLAIVNFLIGAVYLSGNLLLNEGFKRSSASLVGVVVQSFPAVALILSALIFKDAITYMQIIWIALIFIGIFLCTINFKDLKKGNILADIGVRYALIAAAIFSVYFTFFRVFSNQYGWFWPNYISFASFPLVLYVGRKFFKQKDKLTIPKEKTVLASTFMSALLLRGGDIALNYGLANGFGSVTAPLAGASPTLFIVLSSILYKDPVTRQQKIGMGIGLVGIILLSFIR